MKIHEAIFNNHRKCFVVRAQGREFAFPYVKCDPRPSTEDLVATVYIDPEVGREGFTYTLRSGAEGTVLMDQVLDYHRDPAYMKKLLLHRLTIESNHAFADCGLSCNEIARQLNTSPAQVARLLDTANYSKSLDSMVRLLAHLGRIVDVTVHQRTA